MRQRTIWLSSFGAGVATALLFDPVTGRRRRHGVADATAHLMHRAGDAARLTRSLLQETIDSVQLVLMLEIEILDELEATVWDVHLPRWPKWLTQVSHAQG